MRAYNKFVLVIYLVILAFLSLNPWYLPDSSQAIGPVAWDKIDHAVAYCFLSWLILSIYRNHKPQWLISLGILILTIWVGLFFECCQLWLTSTRGFSISDALANVFGAVLGVTLFWCYRFIAQKRRCPSVQ